MHVDRLRRLVRVALCVGAALIIALAYVAERSQAQPRLDAAGTASAVQRFYDQSPVFSAAFTQTYFHRSFNKTNRSSGRVVFKKPGRMRFEYVRPNPSLLVSDGARTQHYDPGARVVADLPPSSAAPLAALSFLSGTGRLGEQFTFQLLDSRREGWTRGYVLALTPRQPSSLYARMVLYVDSRPNLLGVVWRIVIVDHVGNRNRFDFTGPTWDARRVRDDEFRFTAPTGTRRVTGQLPQR